MRPTIWLAAAAFTAVLTSVAAATPLDRPTASELASAAATGDSDARRALVSAERIDGAPVDLERALAGATAEEERARLEAFAEVVLLPPVEDAPELAEAVLSDPAFARAQPSWWDRLWRRAVLRLLGLLDGLSSLPGGPLLVGGIGLALVLGLAFAVTSDLARRRARRVATDRSLREALERGADPDELERAADRAADAEDWSRAVRLRFVAGLARLDAEGTIELSPGLTTHEIAERLASPAFDRLASRFDEVVYGDRPAGPEDDAAARRDWSEVLGVHAR